MSFIYHSEQLLPQPIEDVFAFFADPANLPALMPLWQQARIERADIVPAPRSPISSPTTAASTGTRLTLSFRPFPHAPFRIRWEAQIVEFAMNSLFRDRQVRGPFASWDHSHRLRAIDRQGFDATLVVDHVEYELPFGWLGRLAHRLFLRRQIEDTFAFRQAKVAAIFADSKPRPSFPHTKSA